MFMRLETRKFEPATVGSIGNEEIHMRSGLLWLIGVPIPLILLLAYCTGHL